MQPHYPFLADQIGEGVPENVGVQHHDVWNRLKHGEVSKERVWNAYRSNLELVLEDVELLLNNFKADRAIISADHGNGIGEKGVFGHPPGVATRELRKVPWVAANASDESNHRPPNSHEETSDSVAERLKALGYSE